MGPADVPAGPLGEDHRLRAVLFLDLLQPAFAGIISLVPGDGLEFAFATLPHPLQGPGDAVGMIHVLSERQDPRAGTPLVEGMVFIPLHPQQATILDVEFLAAPAMTSGTGRPGGRWKDFVFLLYLSSPLQSACE